MQSAIRLLKRLVRQCLPASVYGRPPRSGLPPDRLYAWFHTVWQRRHLLGDVVEVGCNECGTSFLTFQLLKRTGFFRRYVGIDTFGGFVADQFEYDVRHGGNPQNRYVFSNITLSYVRRLLARNGAGEIELLRGDIVSVEEDRLPAVVAACLLDVDLEIPIYEGLKRLYPRLIAGGAILVDDCEESTCWGARRGYLKFLAETGLKEVLFMGMGLIEKP